MGIDVPTKPVVPSDERLLARAKLLMEEAMEFVEAAGVKVTVPIKKGMIFGKQVISFDDLSFSKQEPGDLVGMADGLADTMVICAGGLAICGIADLPLLREVDDNNLLKLDTGYFDAERGKFIKAKNHPKPDIVKVLRAQGWIDADVHVPSGSN